MLLQTFTSLLTAMTLASSAQARKADPEVLLGFVHDVGNRELVFHVHSGGCTEKEDFKLQSVSKGGTSELTLVRLVPDSCEAFTQGEILRYSIDDIGIKGETFLTLTNKVEPKDLWIVVDAED